MYALKENIWTLADSPRNAEARRMKEYLDRSLPIFDARLAVLRSSAKLSDNEEKELRFMLEALISAKQILDEKEL